MFAWSFLHFESIKGICRIYSSGRHCHLTAQKSQVWELQVLPIVQKDANKSTEETVKGKDGLI